MIVLVYLLSFGTALLIAFAIFNQGYLLLLAVPPLVAVISYLYKRSSQDVLAELDEFVTLKGFNKALGDIALEKGMLTKADVLKILKAHLKTGKPFGVAACRLNMLTSDQVRELLRLQQASIRLSEQRAEREEKMPKAS